MLVTVIGAVAEDDATKVMSLTSLCIVAMVSLQSWWYGYEL